MASSATPLSCDSLRGGQTASRPPGRGFSLLELVIVICLIGLLTALAARRLLPLRAEAERAALSQVVGGLQAAVSMEMLALLAQGRDDEIARMPRGNPMDLLMQRPSNYLGELDGPNPTQVDAGRWYYDLSQGLLVYRVRYAEQFHSELAGPARARFRVALLYEDRDGNLRFDAGLDRLGGARLEAVEPYEWASADS